ncbi:MAG TPA: sigma-70 family RNA polymerase sigma factor [Parasegetibacter sp.]
MQEETFKTYSKQAEQVIAIKANDEKTLRVLYLENFPKTEKYVLENNGSSEEARDVFQEAFIAVWRNIQANKFRPENETALSGYLYRIAKNKWLDYLRSGHYKRTTSMTETPDVYESQEDCLSEDQEKYITKVKEQFRLLGDNCKELLTRFYYKQESLKKIADGFGWTEATARNNKYRCIQRLRAMMNHDK